MSVAVMIGAGKIGRSFLAKALAETGYGVVFVDKDEHTIELLNEYSQYPVRVVSAEGIAEETVSGYIALHTSQKLKLDVAIEQAELIAVSVGADNLPDVARLLAPVLCWRMKADAKPVNILVCENLIGADRRLREAVYALYSADERALADKTIGFVAACVGRTTPIPPESLIKEHPLYLITDSYDELPVDAATVLGDTPPLKGLKPYTEFEYCIRRKLFIHNAGHAVAAYTGAMRGCTLLTDAMRDPLVLQLTRGAMEESAKALENAYECATDHAEYIDGLLALFSNPDMGDTLARIGRDPMRKTAAGDRLSGAYLFCFENEVTPKCLGVGLTAALMFNPPDDPSAAELQSRLKEEGLEAFLRDHCGLEGERALPVAVSYRAILPQA